MKNLFYVKIKFVKVLEKIHMKTPMKFLQTCTFAKKVQLWNTLFKRLSDIYNGALLFFLQTFICRCVTGS